MSTTRKTQKKKNRPGVADQIREGLREAIAFERGEQKGLRVDRVLVTARHATAEAPPAFEGARIIDLRKVMGVSQSVFASALNVSAETVRAWEQGKNVPGGPALRLLEIAEELPELILSKVGWKPTVLKQHGSYNTRRQRPMIITSGLPPAKVVVSRSGLAMKKSRARRADSRDCGVD